MTSNNTSSPSTECPPFNFDTVDVAVSCLYFLVTPIALLLNGVAAWICVQLRSTSTFIVYLKNVVAADLLMTLTVPLISASSLPGARVELKVLACRYFYVIFFCCLYVNITLMALISLDRFFKIVRPCGKLLGQSLLFSYVTTTLTWLVIFGGTGFPTMILTDQDPGNQTKDFCMSLKGPSGVSLHKGVVIFVDVLFWSASMVVVVCYIYITNTVIQSFRSSGSSNSQGKQKTKLRVFLVLLVFFVCFVPLHIVRIPFTLHEVNEDKICSDISLVIANYVTIWLSTTNTCLDPLMYLYLCREFKDKLVNLQKAIRASLNSHTT